ncbi:hypothetical protein PR001_g25356 [Phytophthora rubi]|uniref:Uncharacterized protein n=1 Tax=Phytophthora rubi TaxID=129364 RepID=A0A6A3I990_9STRA|nr:hypothetical protein PR001_g25356 [Phytophthora rubi]
MDQEDLGSWGESMGLSHRWFSSRSDPNSQALCSGNSTDESRKSDTVCGTCSSEAKSALGPKIRATMSSGGGKGAISDSLLMIGKR